MHLELRAATAEETRSIGEAISSLLLPGDAIALTGELGSGKTTFAQGLARGLGFEGHVVSPTFTLVREYRHARLPVIHADVYRLERVQDVLDLELEQSAEDGVLLVEWGDAVEALLPEGHLVVELAIDDPGDERTIVVRTEGRTWLPRWERLERQLESWKSRQATGEAS
jgi:tRNA threonylcarbamoyladenosine biosynthesis protein TsaE